MEKKRKFEPYETPKRDLKELKYQDLVWQIVRAVRRQARNISVPHSIHDGCIRVAITPLSRVANEWLGGMNDYLWKSREIVDLCEQSFVFQADPSGSYTIRRRNYEGEVETFFTEACTAAMAAYVSRKTWLEHVRNTPNTPHISAGDFVPDNSSGLSDRKGALCTIVKLDGEDFVGLTVSVFIGEPSEDERCALNGLVAAQEFFQKCSGVMKFNPHIDGQKFPLEQVWLD